MENPDSWVVIKVTTDQEIFYKVLAGWSGGYLYGNSWRMNSGIVQVEDEGDRYLFHGHSGSIYCCYKSCYGLRMSTAGTWEQLKEKYPSNVELMDAATDWNTVEWSTKL